MSVFKLEKGERARGTYIGERYTYVYTCTITPVFHMLLTGNTCGV